MGLMKQKHSLSITLLRKFSNMLINSKVNSAIFKLARLVLASLGVFAGANIL